MKNNTMIPYNAKKDLETNYYNKTEVELLVAGGSGGDHKSIACGYNHTVFLLSDGTCKAVGYNGYGQLGDGTTVNKSTPVNVLNVTAKTAKKQLLTITEL